MTTKQLEIEDLGMSRIIAGRLPTQEHAHIVMGRIAKFVNGNEMWLVQNMAIERAGQSASSRTSVQSKIAFFNSADRATCVKDAVEYRLVAMLDTFESLPNADATQELFLFVHVYNERDESRVRRVFREGDARDIQCAELTFPATVSNETASRGANFTFNDPKALAGTFISKKKPISVSL